jgi:ferric iron reductase protein FhuF
MEPILAVLKEQFFIEPVDFSINLEGVSTQDMLNTEMMQKIVEGRTNCFNATDVRLGGANLMKWFGNLITAHLYTYFVHNKWLHYEGIHFIEEGKEAHFQILKPQLIEIKTEDRDQVGKEKITKLIEGLQPLFQQISETSGLSKQQVWGLITNPYYNRLNTWKSEPSIEHKIERDHELLKTLPADTFNLKRNPFDLTFRYVDSWQDSNTKVRIKGACCMSYLKAEGNYCYSCPKLTNAERAVRAEQLRSQE